MEMKLKLVVFLLSAFSGLVFADLPHNFVAGDVIKASEMNANFEDVYKKINAVDDATETGAKSIEELEERVATLKEQIDSLQSSAGSSVVFQGFSTDFVDGDDGYLGLQQACDNTFNGSKICTTGEFIRSRFNRSAANLHDEAYILPSIIGGTEKDGLVIDGLGGLANEQIRMKFSIARGLTYCVKTMLL